MASLGSEDAAGGDRLVRPKDSSTFGCGVGVLKVSIGLHMLAAGISLSS